MCVCVCIGGGSFVECRSDTVDFTELKLVNLCELVSLCELVYVCGGGRSYVGVVQIQWAILR